MAESSLSHLTPSTLTLCQGLTCLVLIIFIGWEVVSRYQKKRGRWKLLEGFRGPPTLPIFGSALLLANIKNCELYNFANWMAQGYGRVCKLWLFNKPYILVADAEVAEKILSSKDANLDKGDDMRVFRPWWGSGLLTATTSEWKGQRKLLNSAFSHTVLLDFIHTFNQQSVQLKDRIRTIVSKSESEGINLIPHITAATLAIICETAMGKRLLLDDGNAEEVKANRAYIKAVTGMYHILLARMTQPWLRPQVLWILSGFRRREKEYLKVLHGFTEKVIREKKEERAKVGNYKGHNNNVDMAEGQKERKAFMDYLLDLSENEDGLGLSDTDIRNQVDTFMAAGHDTTAYTVVWTLFLLSLHPEHQAKVQAELMTITKSRKAESFSYSDLLKMTHLSLCLKETLRMYPIVPFNFRKTSQPIEVDEHRTIPPDTNVVLMPYVMHKDPEYFDSPEKFIPERFSENSHCKGSYIPFSYGPRNCIGQKFALIEAKIILAHLLHTFTFRPSKGCRRVEDVELDLDLVMRPKSGLFFRIELNNG